MIVRRVLLAGAVTALLWAFALQITGGIAIDTPWRLISSRNPVRPLTAGAAVLLWYLVAWRRHWRADLGPLARAGSWPPLIATAAIATALIVGFGWGTRIGAGPDPSGYVSQAAMLARGELTVEAPLWAQDAPWNDAAHSSSPVGWGPTYQTHILAPMYSPGLPLLMAAAQKLAGFDAMFYVVPLLGGVLVWSTYWLGSLLAGAWVGAAAAVLVVCSPTFLLLQQQVMSDVPVAAFLTLAIAGALHGQLPFLAGTAAGAAVLTRPNLVPLVLVPLLLTAAGDRSWRRLIAFGVPVGIACAVVAALNWRYQGSPLVSGYGPLTGYYALAHIEPNLVQYGVWFATLHTPLPIVGLAAPIVAHGSRLRVALVTVAMPVAVLALYVPFLVFDRVDWGYTRFLLPGYPGLFVGAAMMAAAAIARMRRQVLGAVAVGTIAGVIITHGWVVSVRSGVFTQRLGDSRFSRIVEYVRRLPERSVLISNAHSGTIRFYTGRDVLRFEAIRPGELDTAVRHLRRLGYALFLVGDEFEVEQFRTRFANTRTLAALPREPRVNFDGAVVYDLGP